MTLLNNTNEGMASLVDQRWECDQP